ncbi:MAG TPA: circularly permuted type 2 ATP-grasp protein [Burkholderiaceae bacterium]|nr:circularly permuted type 2 ATP-grasp protein [Burkholderiaceae bacterium]
MTQADLQFENPGDPARAAARLAAPAAAGHFDELRDPQGALRPSWQQFFESVGPAAISEFDHRAALLARQVREDGITYNVYSDQQDTSHRWSLDLLPFIVSREDWAQIEPGIVQRAGLLSAILDDVYGEQRLLHESLLPPALVFGNPGYLRSLRGTVPVGGRFLHIVGFDLARGPDGRWWVVGQRTQAPSGLGYALQNRILVSRLFADNFRALQVQRLASGFRCLLETLNRLAPRERNETPRIVLLTPGPYNETYFEQAYLARYLGIPLVEGNDLTVRGERLYLRTLHGLQRVHGVLRRLDDAWCDPLELRPDSALGVPGLLQAVRAGQVLVSNAIGSAFLESHAVHGFLPAVARHLLGTDLMLPARNTWWCGEAAARRDALAHLGRALIRASYPGAISEPPADAEGLPVNLARIRERIDADPELYTVQSYLPFSQTPTWRGNALVPRVAVIRTYAIADADGGWHALPGGLTRIGERQKDVSMQRGGSSADTWVITGGEVDTDTLLDRRPRLDEVARRRIVTSRAAESLFWMGRYTERTDNAVRAVQNVLAALHGDEPLSATVLHAIGRLCAALGLVPAGVPSPAAGPRVFERTLLSALTDQKGATSVAFDLGTLVRNAAELRDRLAPQNWQLIDRTARDFAASLPHGDPTRAAEDVLPALAAVSTGIRAITGVQADGMTRDDGWRLLTIGRQIERLAAISSTLIALFEMDAISLEAGFNLALALFDSTITYRSRYPGWQEPDALIDLLVLDNSNPRSAASTVELLARELAALVESAGPQPAPAGDGLVDGKPGVTLAQLRERDADGRRIRLIGLATRLRGWAFELSDWIGLHYFAHAEAQLRSMIA